MKFALASFLLLLAAPARAEVKLSGYLKDFWQHSRSALDGRAYNLNTFRARASVDAQWKNLRSQVSLDNQVAAGSFFRTTEFRAFGYAPPKPWLDMEHTVSTGTTNGYGVGAYRAWLGWENEQNAVRAGRQRIAWGSGKLWNPTDVLNPYDPTTVEPTERRGVDALYARAGVGSLGQVELAWAPQDRWVDHALLARGRANAAEWDFSALAGKIAGSTSSLMGGGDFAGTFLEGTLHGELAYFHPESRTGYWKAGLGYDYTMPSDSRWTWLRDAAFVTEWYHMGNGATDPRRYDFAALRLGREQGVARNYAGATFSRDLHPLVKLELVGLANAEDASTLFFPSATWNARENLYLSAGWRRFGGERGTEYGRQPNAAILTGQLWF